MSSFLMQLIKEEGTDSLDPSQIYEFQDSEKTSV